MKIKVQQISTWPRLVCENFRSPRCEVVPRFAFAFASGHGHGMVMGKGVCVGVGVAVAQSFVLCGCGQLLPAIEMQQPHAAVIGLAPGNGCCVVGRSCRTPTLRILNACNASHSRQWQTMAAKCVSYCCCCCSAHPLSPIPSRIESNYSHCHLLAGHVDIVSFIPHPLPLSLFSLSPSLSFVNCFPFPLPCLPYHVTRLPGGSNRCSTTSLRKVAAAD